jgi:hypothetical protein
MIHGWFSTSPDMPVDNFVEKSRQLPRKALKSTVPSLSQAGLKKIQSLMNQGLARTPQLS